MVAISVALQKVAETPGKVFRTQGGPHQSLTLDLLSKSLQRPPEKKKLCTTLAEQIAAGGNAQMTFQRIPGHCGIEGNMQADSIAKDASTLPQRAAPVDSSTAKTVIRHHCARKWSRMAKPAVPHATYVNRDQEKDFKRSKDSAFTPPYRRTYTRVGMVPQQNNEKPRPT